MRRSSAQFVAVGVIALTLAPGFGLAKDKKKVPLAPLPAVIVGAKKVFLSNGGGSNLAFDAFYAAMRDWGRYEIVGSPADSDLIIELAYKVDQEGTHVWSTHEHA